MARMKQRTAHYSRLYGAGMARFHVINVVDLSRFRCFIFVQPRPGVGSNNNNNNNTLYIFGQIQGKIILMIG